MGLADLIPGVSGGTVALILGIYKEFISSLKSINFQSIKLLFSLNFKELSKQINIQFLLPIFFGIVCAIFSFSNLISYLLSDYRVLLFSFFFSLILFSSIKLILNQKPYELYKITIVIIGIGIGYFISGLTQELLLMIIAVVISIIFMIFKLYKGGIPSHFGEL